MKKVIIILIIVLIGLGLAWKYWWKNSNNVVHFRLVKIEKGDVIQTVNATGTVQPVKLVQVGTQVNGPILKLYADFNSRVKAGDTVAQIDPAIYNTQVAQNKANLLRNTAEVEQVKTNLTLAEKELTRSKELASKDLISKSDLDTALANRDSLLAQVKVAEASLQQSKSALQQAEVNLGYTTIKSPVDGIVISRNVDEGQTVVASMSAQTIFTIATDLKKMQIEASIPEADIGKIQVGQPVKFTVDAYPDIEFVGKVSEVRLSPTTVQNVVTYTVIIEAENPDEKLFPGMTANLTCEVNHSKDVLKVPNAALRYNPDESLIQKEESSEDKGRNFRPHPTGQGNVRGHRARVWIQAGIGLLKAIPVKTGISDGSFTEVTGNQLSEGQEIVIGILTKEEAANTVVNPFMPQRPGFRRR